MFFVFAWCRNDEHSFKESVPLHLLAESHRRHASTIPITVVVLEGFDKLSTAYIDFLASFGMVLVDYTKQYHEILASYPNLCSRYSYYERNCFLRWIAFREIIRDRGTTEQVWHLDGDVILHSSTDSIAVDSASKTFVLQGCPVLVSITDHDWFSIYATELAHLEADIDGYSRIAGTKKKFLESRDRALCNVSLYRTPIGSDQDLLQYLISAEILMQERTETIFNSRFYFIQNALTAQWWDAYQPTPGATKVSSSAGDGLIKGTRLIPFIHYQNDFCEYCRVYLTLAQYGLATLTPRYISQDGRGGVRPMFRLVSWILRRLGMRRVSRAQIIGKLTETEASKSRLVDIINRMNFET